MRITQMRFYDGARERVCRLGLAGLLLELQEVLLSTRIGLEKTAHTGGMASSHALVDGALEACGGWDKPSTDGVDRIKRVRHGHVFLARLGVELQMPCSSNVSVVNIMHLRSAIIKGLIDVGVVVVPDNRLQVFLPDRTPAFKDAVRYVEEEFKEAMNYPLIIMAVEHDGPGEALPKQARRS